MNQGLKHILLNITKNNEHLSDNAKDECFKLFKKDELIKYIKDTKFTINNIPFSVILTKKNKYINYTHQKKIPINVFSLGTFLQIEINNCNCYVTKFNLKKINEFYKNLELKYLTIYGLLYTLFEIVNKFAEIYIDIECVYKAYIINQKYNMLKKLFKNKKHILNAYLPDKAINIEIYGMKYNNNDNNNDYNTGYYKINLNKSFEEQTKQNITYKLCYGSYDGIFKSNEKIFKTENLRKTELTHLEQDEIDFFKVLFD